MVGIPKQSNNKPDAFRPIFSLKTVDCRHSVQNADARPQKRTDLVGIRRVKKLVSILVCLVCGFLVVYSGASGLNDNAPSVRYTVRAGDTVYKIAEREDKSMNLHDVVDWIYAHNKVNVEDLQAGQILVIPKGRSNRWNN